MDRRKNMYEKILVPLDGSEMAEWALPYVEGLAKNYKSEVTLVTACTPGAGLERPFAVYLSKIADELYTKGLEISSLCIYGDAAAEILNFADKNDVNLIIMSAYGKSGPGIWAMGSIASKVVQRSNIPVLLIRTGSKDDAVKEKDFKKVMLPLDGSEFSEAVIPYAESLAEKMKSELIVARVIEPIQLPRITYRETEVDIEKHEKKLMDTAERKVGEYLSKLVESLKEKGINAKMVSLQGRPADTILGYSENNDISLIVMATHGYSGISKWAYGSVASRIIEGSKKPLLVVRPPQKRAK
jgi:nucleotide-binding universal stress UspA family protein